MPLGDPRISRTSLLFREEWGWPNRDYPCAGSATCCGCRPLACPSARLPPVSGLARPPPERACAGRAKPASVGRCHDLDDAALESRLYPVPTTPAKDWRSLPDWPAIHRELRRKGVTLQLVWEEYRAAHPDGYDLMDFGW